MAKTILVVDDDANIRDTAKDILEDAGYKVEVEGSCAAAIQVLKSVPVDVAIFDFNLPDGLGVDLAVKSREIQASLVILLLTGEAQVNLGLAQSIIHSTLTKPVSPAELIGIIRKIVDL
jgi:DNA-binding response OmpR family regulator